MVPQKENMNKEGSILGPNQKDIPENVPSSRGRAHFMHLH